MMIDLKKATATCAKEYWGTVGGKEVFLFTLANGNGVELKVTNYGAAIQALTVPDSNNLPVDVVLGYGSLQAYVDDAFYMGTIVGRCANRIANGKVIIGEKTFNLSVKEGGYHHHGGTKGFNQQVWDVKEATENNISFSYLSPDGEEGYPGNVETVVTFSLDENNCWSIVIHAKTDQPTLFNPTHHAYFNLEGSASATIGNHYLQLNAKCYLPVNKMQVPVGVVAKVNNGPFDFTQLKLVNRHINEADEQILISNGFDHSWVLEEEHTPQLKEAATVYAHVSGIQMNVFTTEPAIHFYSGNFLNVSSAKNGESYPPRSGFCLETQHFPDAPNHPHFPSIVLMPEKEFFSKTVFQFSTRHTL